jgi:serine-type D-Ala-D-Ala carboxypeptidase (penicillin-binding protein 5/6)
VSELRVRPADQSRRPAGGRRSRRVLVHGAVRGTLGLVITAAALLGLMSSPAKEPAASALARPAPQPARPSQRAPRPVHRGYALLPAPAYERVTVRLKKGLRSGLLFDVRTGRALWQVNPTRILPIASLTKMMTALVVVSDSRPDQRFLITTAATHFTGSGVGLLPLGKRVSREALLYGLLLPSGNDAAIALAQGVAGNQRRFIALMNARSRAMGLTCTHFASVSGIVDRGNFSCAADLGVLAHAVLVQPRLGPIVASRSAILPFPIKAGKLFLYNNNPLLRDGFPGTDGVKTGYTDAAGFCLVVAARGGRDWLAVVLLHSGDDITQAENLLNAGFARLASARKA